MRNIKLPDSVKLQVYGGSLITPNTPDKFEWLGALKRYQYLQLGDIVYFMFVDNILAKIGAAGGHGGWPSRCSQYKKGVGGDSTNDYIYEQMKLRNKNQIDVYMISAPKKQVEMTCPLTNKPVIIDVATHKELEQYYTQRYLAENKHNELFLSKQLN